MENYTNRKFTNLECWGKYEQKCFDLVNVFAHGKLTPKCKDTDCDAILEQSKAYIELSGSKYLKDGKWILPSFAEPNMYWLPLRRITKIKEYLKDWYVQFFICSSLDNDNTLFRINLKEIYNNINKENYSIRIINNDLFIAIPLNKFILCKTNNGGE